VFATGNHESLVTKLLQRHLHDQVAEFYYEKEKLNLTEAAIRLSRFVAGILETAFTTIEEADERVQKQIELANELLLWLQSFIQNEEFSANLIEVEGQLLKAIFAR
jgi:hypothetical protein